MISIIIPANNEQDNLEPLVKKLLIYDEVIIVNDNSTDKTAVVAYRLAKSYPNVKCIHRLSNAGMGNALRLGTKKAKGDKIVWVMGDMCDDLTTIPKLIEALGVFDLAIGSRYCVGGSTGELNKFKALLGRLYTLLINIKFGMAMKDSTNAFRAFRKSAYKRLSLKSTDFAISPEFTINAIKEGFLICEVATTYKGRKVGYSKFNMFNMGKKYLKLLY